MTHPSDLPIPSPEERAASDAAHEADPWRGPYMGTTTSEGRAPVFIDAFDRADDIAPDVTAWQGAFMERLHLDRRKEHLARSPHTDFPRAYDTIGPDGEIEHHVVEPGQWQGIRPDRVALVVDEVRHWVDGTFALRLRRDSRAYWAEALRRADTHRETQIRSMGYVFGVPARILGLPTLSAAQRRLRTQMLRTKRRAERRARRGR